MRTLLEFKSAWISRYNTAEYLNFMSRFQGTTMAIGAEALHYEEADMTRLGQLLTDMQDLVSRNMAAIETADLQSLEEQRDEMGLYIINTVRNSRDLPFEAIATAANALWYVLSPYVGFYRLPNMQETATLDGMLMDLMKEENATHVATLSLTEKVADLYQVNAQYRNLTDQRTISRDAAKTADSKTLRTEMDALYNYITAVAYAHNVVSPTAELERYINSINAIIAETNAAYNQRMGQTKSEEEEE